MAEEELRFARGATITIEDLGIMAQEGGGAAAAEEPSLAQKSEPAVDEFGFEEGFDEAALAACDQAVTPQGEAV